MGRFEANHVAPAKHSSNSMSVAHQTTKPLLPNAQSDARGGSQYRQECGFHRQETPALTEPRSNRLRMRLCVTDRIII
jgi:hypothetical protein